MDHSLLGGGGGGVEVGGWGVLDRNNFGDLCGGGVGNKV